MKAILILLVGLACISYSSPIPRRESIEIIVTPQDLKNAAEYAVVKIPELKDNFKTLVKQKLLNRIISKDFQQLITEVDPITGKVSLSRSPMPQQSQQPLTISNGGGGGATSEKSAGNVPSQDIRIQLPKDPGLVTTILKGVEEADDNTTMGSKDTFETDCTDDESAGEENEHVGYNRPYKTKTNHKDMGIKGGKLDPPDPFDDNEDED
ncbi:hypothetical protein DFJ63DRAFT_335037 [Scheffersomyces coipomensis]|uniref:uncharacterized protein n=1 Tax=Scheffersomyces coipomensis TaxID=1788519 RepID=UPI00315C702F